MTHGGDGLPVDLWEDPSTAYNPDSSAVRKTLRQVAWKRRYLWWQTWVFIPLCVLTLLAVAGGRAAGGAGSAASSTQVNESAGKTAAYQAVQSWLASTPSPLPGGAIAAWDGYTVQDPPAPENGADPSTVPQYKLETDTFTVTAGAAAYRVAVQVATGPGGTATATSTPSLAPVLDAAVPGTVTPWFGLQEASPSGAVQQAVTTWADAYTSGSAAALRRAVQDTDYGHTYLPLSGVAKVASVQTGQAAWAAGPDGKPSGSTMIVQATVSVWWDGQARPRGQQAATAAVPAPFTFDLLVQQADTASPVVVAWGPPGAGPHLKPYQNAITGVDVAQQQQAQQSATGPTPAPTVTAGDQEAGQ